jgi:hypothetical protein
VFKKWNAERGTGVSRTKKGAWPYCPKSIASVAGWNSERERRQLLQCCTHRHTDTDRGVHVESRDAILILSGHQTEIRGAAMALVDLCRLCGVDTLNTVSYPIFEGEGCAKRYARKIAECLTLQVRFTFQV